MTKIFHPEYAEMKRILTKYGIQCLYHFTAVDNLAVISECGGLLSKQKLEKARLLDKIITGGNELSLGLDKTHGNWDKVHLYFCPNTPMAYRIQQYPEGRNPQGAHICYLLIDPIVATWEGVFFTDTNATQTIDGHQRKQGLEGLRLIDFDTIRAHLAKRWVEPKQKWHRNVQAECLVPDGIPIEHIKEITFISQASQKEGIRLWRKRGHPTFNIDKNLFSSGFPLVDDFKLTPEEITKEKVNATTFQDKTIFSKKSDNKITILLKIYVTACARAKFIWRNNIGNPILQENTEFERESRYWHWSSLDIEKLDIGSFSVQYYLNDTRWVETSFQIKE
ncbi:MAG: DUF4433 domain-containing protein [Deltaproteobacteria bacterium]|nr:DUF4433 domain-containing protein [Deltaproteobacteria bacterium]